MMAIPEGMVARTPFSKIDSPFYLMGHSIYSDIQDASRKT
jgi:hypothetical protein